MAIHIQEMILGASTADDNILPMFVKPALRGTGLDY